jgi:hypothetical protein
VFDAWCPVGKFRGEPTFEHVGWLHQVIVDADEDHVFDLHLRISSSTGPRTKCDIRVSQRDDRGSVIREGVAICPVP